MANWMTDGRKTYDNLGLTLQRFGAMFVGISIGQEFRATIRRHFG